MINKDILKIVAGGKCPKHPRWQKKARPKSLCQNCWFLWFLKHLADGTLDLNLR
jgi:hypothetical protein